jgi:hypothetical protein
MVELVQGDQEQQMKELEVVEEQQLLVLVDLILLILEAQVGQVELAQQLQ